MPSKYRFASTIRCKIKRILKLDHFVNYSFSKNNIFNYSIVYVNDKSTIKVNISRMVIRKWLVVLLELPMSSFILQNLTEIEAVTGYNFACDCHTAFGMLSCLQINCQPFYLRQLLKFHLFHFLIEMSGQLSVNETLKPSIGTNLILRKLVHIEIDLSCSLSCCECVWLILLHMFNYLTFGGQLKPSEKMSKLPQLMEKVGQITTD